MQIVEEDEVSAFLDDEAYTTISFRDNEDIERYLVFSKEVEDNLPLITTAVKPGTPCMHPEERSITYDTTLYPLENDLFTP